VLRSAAQWDDIVAENHPEGRPEAAEPRRAEAFLVFVFLVDRRGRRLSSRWSRGSSRPKEKPSMKFLCVYRSGVEENDNPPNPQEMEAMGKLIGEMSKAGVLLATEGCMSSAKGSRLRIDSGKISVTDGPFLETRELISGFCLMQCKTKAEAIEWGKRFLNVVGRGETEIRQISEMSAA
jgi:hypothetical protein